LKEAGFIVNVEKSEWKPLTKVEWYIGFMINLSKGGFSIPVEKINALKARLLEIKSIGYVPARCLTSIVGKISSTSLGLGTVTKLMTRSLYATLNKKLSWCQRLKVPTEALVEIEFWLDRLEEFNGQAVKLHRFPLGVSCVQ